MRLIQKKEAPESLLKYARNHNAYYDGYSKKDDVKKQLLEEQGHLCGYCMRRIKSEKDTKIEHMIPQSVLRENPRKALDYKIMVGVCYGNENRTESGKKRRWNELTCDAHRGNQELKAADPFDPVCISKIKYKPDGEIFSEDTALEHDLNVVLNLNFDGDSAYLKKNRREVLKACKEKMKRMKREGQWSRSFLKRIIEEYEKPDAKGYLKPYSGIALWYLKKRVGEQ